VDASRTRVRGQHSSRLLAAEEGESHLGNRLGLWPSTCWRRRSKAACRRASPLTAAVATRRRPRSKLLRKLPFASFIASLRSRSRRGSRAPRSSSRRRRAPAPTAACARASPAPRRYHGRPPPPLPLAAACRRDWLRALDKHLDDVLRCSCRRSKLVSPSPLAAGVATTRRHSRWLHRHWRHGDAATWARCSLHSCVRLGGLGASEMADASAQRRLCPARASSSSHAANRSGVSRLCESRGACGPAKKSNLSAKTTFVTCNAFFTRTV